MSAEVVLCMHKTTILCQLGLSCHQLTTISPSILNHFWWELYQTYQAYQETQSETSDRQMNAHFFYHDAQTNQAKNGSLVNRGAN